MTASAAIPFPTEQEQAVRDFFVALYGADAPGWLTIWDKQTKQTRWFSASQPAAAARKALELAPSCDVYFGLGLRGEKLDRGRGELKDITAIPGLWLDVDCSHGAHAATNLPTLNEAWAFVKVNLIFPPSIVVFSGGGIHAYWLFNHPWVFKDDAARKQCAQQLEAFQRGAILAASERGWRLDNTSDLPRVLRVPGTFNHKSGQPVPVELKDFDPGIRYSYNDINALISQMPKAAAPASTAKGKTWTPAQAQDGPPADAARIQNKCAFFRHCVEDAANLPELEWYAALTIAARCDEGRRVCHEISSPYPRYTERETDEKIDHALADTGPYTCDKIRQEFGTYCDGCPAKVTSPIVLGTPPAVDETPIEDQIASLPEHLDFQERTGAWRALIRSIARKGPVAQAQAIKLIQDRYKFGVKAIRDEIKAVEAEIKLAPPVPTPLEEPRAVDWSLAQDMRGDILHYGIWLPTNKGEFVIRLIKSDWTYEDVADAPAERLPKDSARWSVDAKTPYNVFAYLNRAAEDSPRALFQDLRAFFRRFMWYSDERTYDLLALWVMESYVFMTFDQVGYLALVGTKRAGKTRLFELLEMLCFNAVLSTSVSDSYVFRSVEVDRTTMLVDEADQLKAQAKEGVNERLEILRSGYRRSGMVGRIEGEDRKRVDFSTYSMKAIANVSGLEDALEDRTLAIPVERKPKHIQVEKLIHRRLRPEAQILRNRLYCFGLTNAARLAKIYDTLAVDGVDDREAEIWSGIITIAKVAAEERIPALLDLARANSARKELHEGSESTEAQEIMAVWQLANDEQPDVLGTRFYKASRIQETIKDQLGWDNFSYKKLATDLVKLKIIDDTREFKERFRLAAGSGGSKTSCVMCYLLDREKIATSAERFGVTLLEDRAETNNDDPY